MRDVYEVAEVVANYSLADIPLETVRSITVPPHRCNADMSQMW